MRSLCLTLAFKAKIYLMVIFGYVLAILYEEVMIMSINENGLSKLRYLTFEKVSLLVIVTAILISAFVLFREPMPGIADQGDFQRVMDITGLDEKERGTAEFESHWYKYVTTEYKMVPQDLRRLVGIIPTTSMIYPIAVVKAVSRLLGRQYFSTKLLAIIYAALYIVSLYMCIKWINIKKRITAIFFSLLSLFILMDGNYLIWFNSLYGEPMMITGFLFFIGSALFVLRKEKSLGYREAILLFISAFLFLGAKMQCFPALPFILLLIIRIIIIQKPSIQDTRVRKRLAVAIFALIFYVGGIYVQINSSCGVDTEYNSVFYGILKNSRTPEEDLAVLGLPEDMSAEAGKHAYLPKDQYVKYTPWSDLTKNEFNDKVSNLKLLGFYLSQPARFLEAMEYTASQSFDTRGYLGKYERSSVSEYTYNFNRFTKWSDFRKSKLPKKFLFIVSFYILAFVISFKEYLKNKCDKRLRMRIELFWLVMIISTLQFPMPYIGNGEADTGKQLFLFNYSFDIVLIIASTWFFDKSTLFFKKIYDFIFGNSFQID
jgi:hypothetical protein